MTRGEFIKSEIVRLDRDRCDLETAIKNKHDGCGLEEMQGNLFKINIIINYLGSFILDGGLIDAD